MATRAPEVAPALRQARFAAAAGFFTQGLVFISLTTRLPVVQEKWSLSSVEMSVLLLMMVLLAGWARWSPRSSPSDATARRCCGPACS
jgi:cytochrome bd-type quinol oxidase subunit 1